MKTITKQQLIELVQKIYDALSPDARKVPIGKEGTSPNDWMVRIRNNSPEVDEFLVAFAIGTKDISISTGLAFLREQGKSNTKLYRLLAAHQPN